MALKILVERKHALKFRTSWIIHESSLLQMQGTAHEVVVLHYECAVTKQMRQDRLAHSVKNADIYKKEAHGNRAKCYAEGNIKVNGRYNGKYILVSAFFMNNPRLT